MVLNEPLPLSIMLFQENELAPEPAIEKRVVVVPRQMYRLESSCEAAEEVSREVDDQCLSPGSVSAAAWASGRCVPLDEGRQGAPGSFQKQRQTGRC